MTDAPIWGAIALVMAIDQRSALLVLLDEAVGDSPQDIAWFASALARRSPEHADRVAKAFADVLSGHDQIDIPALEAELRDLGIPPAGEDNN